VEIRGASAFTQCVELFATLTGHLSFVKLEREHRISSQHANEGPLLLLTEKMIKLND